MREYALLDLAHRLPLTWARLREGEAEPWVDRAVARAITAPPGVDVYVTPVQPVLGDWLATKSRSEPAAAPREQRRLGPVAGAGLADRVGQVVADRAR